MREHSQTLPPQTPIITRSAVVLLRGTRVHSGLCAATARLLIGLLPLRVLVLLSHGQPRRVLGFGPLLLGDRPAVYRLAVMENPVVLATLLRGPALFRVHNE